MERMGAPSHRNRTFSFVERIIELGQAQESTRLDYVDDDGFRED